MCLWWNQTHWLLDIQSHSNKLVLWNAIVCLVWHAHCISFMIYWVWNVDKRNEHALEYLRMFSTSSLIKRQFSGALLQVPTNLMFIFCLCNCGSRIINFVAFRKSSRLLFAVEQAWVECILVNWLCLAVLKPKLTDNAENTMHLASETVSYSIHACDNLPEKRTVSQTWPSTLGLKVASRSVTKTGIDCCWLPNNNR